MRPKASAVRRNALPPFRDSGRAGLIHIPLYYFAVLNSDRHDDPDGTELPDDAAARTYARKVIRELQHGEGTQLEGMDDGGHAGSTPCVANPF